MKVKEQGATIHQLTHHLKLLQTQLQSNLQAAQQTQQQTPSYYAASASLGASTSNPYLPTMRSSASYPQPAAPIVPVVPVGGTPHRPTYSSHYSPYPHALPPELTTSMIGGGGGRGTTGSMDAEVPNAHGNNSNGYSYSSYNHFPLPPWDVSALPRPTPNK